jgi:hypothetical protein
MIKRNNITYFNLFKKQKYNLNIKDKRKEMLMARSPSQKDPFMVIDESERPPVVAYGGRSPAKSPLERQRISGDFQKALGPYIHTVVTTASPHGNGVITPRTR